jgi:hypothetical protein
MDLGKLAELSHHRKCLECGAEFESNEKESALVQFADHSTIHNPTPEQWAEAYERIQAGKERVKERS